jgi:hypothetical protein
VCGLQFGKMTIAHLDHNAGNNDADNLAFLFWTHHWMYDCELYPLKAIRLPPLCSRSKAYTMIGQLYLRFRACG